MAELLQKVGIGEAERASLQEKMAATPVARAGGGPGGGARTSASSTVADEVLSQAHAALKAHLAATHPGLVAYLDELVALGVDRVEDLAGLDDDLIELLNLKILHKSHFLKACGR